MTNFPPRPPAQTPPPLATRVDELRASVSLVPLTALSLNSGASIRESSAGEGGLYLFLLGDEVLVPYPQLVATSLKGDILKIPVQALLMYYLLTANGAPQSGRWVSFAELPGGRMYAQAFQGYSGDEIVRAFEDSLPALEKACIAFGGKKLEQGNLAFEFEALPRVKLALVYWQGDEDFPSSCKILFDASVPNYLPTDVCAILGSMLAQKIIRSK